ncbi:sporulation protein YpjB [Oceanobacillus sp. 1P07AA]|uniref:sporulation protein YpjB n=1 Tax=Oceanobacillus sp. 1P07AA TaxID=3132293 RepID=UPI0039A75D4F
MGDRKRRLVRLMTTVFIGIFFFDVHSVAASSLSSYSIIHSGMVLSPFSLGVIIVGGCIIGTLSYVSWRKYKAEVKGESKARKNDKSVD